jgi:hypothetical protein
MPPLSRFAPTCGRETRTLFALSSPAQAGLEPQGSAPRGTTPVAGQSPLHGGRWLGLLNY